MKSRMEDIVAKGTRMVAFAMWAAVGAAYLPSVAANVSAREIAPAKCSDSCDGCQINNCKFCGQVNGVQCYDPIKPE